MCPSKPASDPNKQHCQRSSRQAVKQHSKQQQQTEAASKQFALTRQRLKNVYTSPPLTPTPQPLKTPTKPTNQNLTNRKTKLTNQPTKTNQPTINQSQRECMYVCERLHRQSSTRVLCSGTQSGEVKEVRAPLTTPPDHATRFKRNPPPTTPAARRHRFAPVFASHSSRRPRRDFCGQAWREATRNSTRTSQCPGSNRPKNTARPARGQRRAKGGAPGFAFFCGGSFFK